MEFEIIVGVNQRELPDMVSSVVNKYFSRDRFFLIFVRLSRVRPRYVVLTQIDQSRCFLSVCIFMIISAINEHSKSL
jgi:hypothetical protein